ncbi:PAS domain S-box protein [Candidatus Poribacteria bacterium]|nr:PAS domain S-box protein [Candidatus Poribacteria bacterium]
MTVEKQRKSRARVSPGRRRIRSRSSTKWIEAMFESFIDSIDVGVFVLDTAGTINRVNRFILEHYRWELSELIGKNIFELMPDLLALGVQKGFKEIVGLRLTRELMNIEREDRQGARVVFNLKGIPIVEGNEVRGVLAVMNDITEKRALESQVAETEEYLRSLIDNANDIIYTLDREGYITFLNKMGQKITGYSFDSGAEIRGHYSEYVVKKDVQKNEKKFHEAIEGKPQRFESEIVSVDGRHVNVLINITPIRKGEKIVGVLGIARDVTERKQMEAQLLQASKMAAIGELAAGVAHEINNPVGIISGAAEQLQFVIDHYRDRPEELMGKLSQHLDVIREQAVRCKKITQGLLNFARKTELRASEVNVTRLLQETVALVENRTNSEHKRIETHMPSDPPKFYSDPHLLEQVFLNLVNNALDAVKEGGTVIVKGRTENNWLIMDFIDDGIGISDEAQKKIFDPFFTTKPIGKGTGLGLSICFGIVQRMSGTISVDSKPGVGTTFTVRLPVERGRRLETM